MGEPVTVFSDILQANDDYARDFGHSNLPAPPRKKLAVLTCMDSRIQPNEAFGLHAGDAHLIRIAGARATPEVVRSLRLAINRLGVTRVAVIRHTNCASGSPDPEADLRDDLYALRHDPELSDATFCGFVYDVENGRLTIEDDDAPAGGTPA